MISLCFKSNNLNVINFLMKYIKNINLDNIIFSHKTFSKYENVIVHFSGRDLDSFYKELSSVLCNCIIDIYESKFIDNIISLNYFYFDSDDILKIKDNCIEFLNGNNSNDLSYKHFNYKESNDDFSNRIKCLNSLLYDYISNNKNIYLDGFINFRIKDYIKYLDDLVDSAVNQLVVDKEYFDFIDLLKLYINSKPPIYDVIHLVYYNENSVILDKDNNLVVTDKNILDLHYLSDITFSSNDYTLNTLLSLMPNKLVVHLLSDKDEFINTLSLVFEDRISFCYDCDICRPYRLLDIGI